MSDAPAAPVTENGVPPETQESIQEETPGFKVFAGNLAYTTTDEGLKAFFAPVQDHIISAQVIQRGHRSAGYGFVSLSNAEAVQQAVELLNKKELDGREVVVEAAKPPEQKSQENKERKPKKRNGRRGSKAVPGEVTEAEANGEATQAEGDAPAAEEGNTESNKPRKKKFYKRNYRRKSAPTATEGEAAEPTSAAEATDAAEATPAAPKKKGPKKPRASRPKRPAGEDPVGEPSKTMVFVANLGFSIDDAALAALFTEAGIEVKSARIVRARWGQPRRSKGYGFVDVGNEEGQQKAIDALQGKEVGGRTIAVKVAVKAAAGSGDEAAEGEAAAPAAEDDVQNADVVVLAS